MSDVKEMLVRLKAASVSKSYLIGLERGRVWAMDSADFFELRQWKDFGGDDFANISLPGAEEAHYHVLKAETALEWGQYVRGWIDGVKEAARP
jgi:hypothetical protein